MADKISITVGVVAVGLLAAVFWASHRANAGKPRPQQIEATVFTDPEPRFHVTLVAEFSDRLAYRETRKIFLLVDRSTGREFVGISGVGISEVGMHEAGTTKSRHKETDER